MLAIAQIVCIFATFHPPSDGQVVALTSQLQNSSDSIELLTQRGIVFFHSHQYDRALADFESALALSPGDPALIRHKAATLNDAGFSLAALAVLDRHIANNNTDVDALYLRARIHVSLDLFVKAIADCEKVLDLAKSPRPEVFLELADTYLRSGNLQGREKTLARGITLLGPLAHFLEPLARTQIALADFEKALATIEQFAKLSPHSFVPRLLAAERLESMGNLDPAMQAFSSLILAIDQSPRRIRTDENSQSSRQYATQAVLRLTAIKESRP